MPAAKPAAESAPSAAASSPCSTSDSVKRAVGHPRDSVPRLPGGLDGVAGVAFCLAEGTLVQAQDRAHARAAGEADHRSSPPHVRQRVRPGPVGAGEVASRTEREAGVHHQARIARLLADQPAVDRARGHLGHLRRCSAAHHPLVGDGREQHPPSRRAGLDAGRQALAERPPDGQGPGIELRRAQQLGLNPAAQLLVDVAGGFRGLFEHGHGLGVAAGSDQADRQVVGHERACPRILRGGQRFPQVNNGVVGPRRPDLGLPELGQDGGPQVTGWRLVQRTLQVPDRRLGRAALHRAGRRAAQRVDHPWVRTRVARQQVRNEALGLQALRAEHPRRFEVARRSLGRGQQLGDGGPDDRMDELERTVRRQQVGADQRVLGGAARVVSEPGEAVGVPGLDVGAEHGDGPGEPVSFLAEAGETLGHRAADRAAAELRQAVWRDGNPGISGRERTEQRPDQERITSGRGVAWASQLVRYQAAAIAPHQFGYRGGAERRGHEPGNRRVGFECADELGHVGLHRGPVPVMSSTGSSATRRARYAR